MRSIVLGLAFATAVPVADLHGRSDRSPSSLPRWNELDAALAELNASETYPTVDEILPLGAMLDRLVHDFPDVHRWPNATAESFVIASCRVSEALGEAGSPTDDRLRVVTRGRAVAAASGISADRLLEYGRSAIALSTHAGEIALNEGRLDEGHRAFARSIRDMNRCNDLLLLPRVRVGLAETRRLQGRFADAETQLDHLEEWLDGVASENPEPGRPTFVQWFASAETLLRGARIVLYADMGLPDQAARWLAKKPDAGDATAPDDEYAEIDLRAVVALAGERCQRVVGLIDDELLARTPVHWRGILRTRRGVALAELALRDPSLVDAARRDLEDASIDAPSFGLRKLAEVTLLDLAVVRADWDDVRARLAALRRDADAPAPHVDEQALLAVHAMRLARATGATDDERKEALARLQEAYGAQLAAWKSARTRSGGVGFLNYSSRRSVVGELIRETIAGSASPALDETVLEPLFRGEAVGTLARQLDAPAATLDAIRSEILRDDFGWIAFVPAWQSTHVFAVDRDEIVHAEIAWCYLSEPLRNDLGDRVALVIPRGDAAAVAKHRAAVEREASTWSERLIPPNIRRKLSRWSGCYVTGLELLGNPPIEVLPLDGRPLGVAKAIARVPSMTVALALARRPKIASGADSPALRLIAAPELDDKTKELAGRLPALSLGDASKRALLEPFDGSLVEQHFGANATLDALRDGASRPPRILHVLAHAIERLDREDFATLVLAGTDDERGFVSPTDGNSWLRANVLILSACAAARGPSRIGDDGAAQFVGAGFRAGARCVLAADERIELEATIEFGRLVHRELARGTDAAEAVRRAREQMWSSDDFDLPSCWATIAVHGLAFDE